MVLDLMMGPSPFESTLFVFNSFGSSLFVSKFVEFQSNSISIYLYSSIIYLFIIYALICIVAMRTTLAVVEAQNAPAWQNITVVKSWASFLGHSSLYCYYPLRHV